MRHLFHLCMTVIVFRFQETSRVGILGKQHLTDSRGIETRWIRRGGYENNFTSLHAGLLSNTIANWESNSSTT